MLNCRQLQRAGDFLAEPLLPPNALHHLLNGINSTNIIFVATEVPPCYVIIEITRYSPNMGDVLSMPVFYF
jgi:hypothetical protein